MALSKSVAIELRPNTWPAPLVPPPAIIAAAQAGPYSVDVLSALIFTALWTRPPVRYGFSLADTWAWLRYLPALCASPELRLCEEWTTLDPHQKTVLSGDFGVGFTTWFLNRELGFVKYSDTLWVVNTLQPSLFELGASAKRGPRKAPDYIAQDRVGNYSVVECKGTQTSRQGLLDAMERGLPQKQNLRAVGGVQLAHSLVAGLFVPQYESGTGPVLMIADPDWEDVQKELGRFSREQIGRGVSQIAYAKELATLDLAHTANALAKAKGSAESIGDAFSRDLATVRPSRTTIRDEVVTKQEYIWDRPTNLGSGFVVEGVRFEGSIPADEVHALRSERSPSAVGERKRDEDTGHDWTVEADESSVLLRSPSKNSFRMSLLRR